MKKAIDQIKHLVPCEDAVEWVGSRTVEEMIQECPRGDWLFWLAARFGIGLRKLTLAKGLCAKTVIHLMEDQRSRDAVKAAIDYGRYRIGDEELDASWSAAYAAASWAGAASWAASWAASRAASGASRAASWAADASRAASWAADARKKNRLETAAICRKVFGQQLINAINKYNANN